MRDFVPVEAFIPGEAVEAPQEPVRTPTFLSADASDTWDARTSLFGDAER